jgi:hypothetical protein
MENEENTNIVAFPSGVDQVEALNRLAREQAGSQVDDPPPPAPPEIKDSKTGPEMATFIELPRVGRPDSVFAREAGAVCREHGVYRRDTIPVLVNRESGSIDVLRPETFQTYVERLAVTYKAKWKKDEDGELIEIRQPTTMPVAVAKTTLASHQFIYQQRSLERVNLVRQPVMRGDGRVELLPVGYDEETGILTRDSDVVVSDDMTLEIATALLVDLHQEFDFAGWNKERNRSRDLSAHIASMLAFYGASLLPPLASRLGALYNANSHRSGKTLLFKLCVAPVLGRVRVRSLPKNDEEFRKMLDSAALNASPYIILDDVGGNLRNNDLNAFMTSAYWSGRVMHTQKEFEVVNRSMVFVTGHSLSVESDLAGRLLQVKLHLEEADVRERRIRRVIDDEYLARPAVRGDILTALWTIIREWDAAGRPKGKTRMGGFEKWCEIFGGMVDFAGFGDPCERPPDDGDADTEYEDMMALVKELTDMIDEGGTAKEFTFSEVLEVAVESNCFSWIIEGRWVNPRDEPKYYDPKPKTMAIMGKLFADKYGGRTFKLDDGRRVSFGKKGKNRSRKYEVTLVG